MEEAEAAGAAQGVVGPLPGWILAAGERLLVDGESAELSLSLSAAAGKVCI